jgi:two-component system response regulator FixJ
VARSDRLTVAVVDDDADVRTALARLLRSLGHDVYVFASAEAFEASASPTDCVILDVRLPGLSGLELRDRLRARGSVPPIVFITGDGDRFLDEASAMRAPALHKPFNDEDLAAAISEAVTAAGGRR